MKRNLATALVIALALVVTPLGGSLVNIATASSNNTVTGSGNNTTTGSDNNTNTGSDNNTKPDEGNKPGNGDVVIDSDGKEIESEISTDNTSETVESVAVTTPEEKVNDATGLTPERVDKGEHVVLTVTDSKCNASEKNAVTKAAEAVKSAIAAILDIDLDIKDKTGAVVESITNLKKAIEIVIAAPEGIDAATHDFAIVRLHDGKTDILPDLDNDPATITFKTDRFSVYAVAYGEKGSFDEFKDKGNNTDSDNQGSDNDDEQDEVPKTGDEALPALPVAAAGAVFAAAAVLLKKKEA